jgi:hypothetical protein
LGWAGKDAVDQDTAQDKQIDVFGHE